MRDRGGTRKGMGPAMCYKTLASRAEAGGYGMGKGKKEGKGGGGVIDMSDNERMGWIRVRGTIVEGKLQGSCGLLARDE